MITAGNIKIKDLNSLVVEDMPKTFGESVGMDKSIETHKADDPPSECTPFTAVAVSPTAPFALAFSRVTDHGSSVRNPTRYHTFAHRGNSAEESSTRNRAESLIGGRDTVIFQYNFSVPLLCGSQCEQLCSNGFVQMVSNAIPRAQSRDNGPAMHPVGAVSGPGIAENSLKQSCVIEGIEQFTFDVKPKYYQDLLAHYDYKKYQADHMYHADPKMYKEQTEEWPHFKAPQQTPVKVWQDKKPHQKADNHL